MVGVVCLLPCFFKVLFFFGFRVIILPQKMAKSLLFIFMIKLIINWINKMLLIRIFMSMFIKIFKKLTCIYSSDKW